MLVKSQKQSTIVAFFRSVTPINVCEQITDMKEKGTKNNMLS